MGVERTGKGHEENVRRKGEGARELKEEIQSARRVGREKRGVVGCNVYLCVLCVLCMCAEREKRRERLR